jgi:uncharacterized membrane protein YbjE (DUF340 family)
LRGDRESVERDELVGLPEITPVVGSSASPAGSAGATANDVTLPVQLGTLSGMATPRAYSAGLRE